MSPSETPPVSPEDPEPNRRSSIAALIFLALLFAGSLWVFQLIERHREIQACIASGRRDCIDLTGQNAR